MCNFIGVSTPYKEKTVLKLITENHDRLISFDRINALAGRATPDNFMRYRHSLLLHKCFNDDFTLNIVSDQLGPGEGLVLTIKCFDSRCAVAGKVL